MQQSPVASNLYPLMNQPTQTWLTQEAADRLKAELTDLEGPLRAEIIKKIETARAEDPPTYPREHVYNTQAYPSTYTHINTHHGLETHISPHTLNPRMTSPQA